MVMMVYSQKNPKHISRQCIESVLESFRSFSGPLLLKPKTGQELYFTVSYSKPALTTDDIYEKPLEMQVHTHHVKQND